MNAVRAGLRQLRAPGRGTVPLAEAASRARSARLPRSKNRLASPSSEPIGQIEPAAVIEPGPVEERHPIFSVIVNESGASVYSASDSARQEFPKLDLTVRGAISIARRLQDPLAELVKIHPEINRRRAVSARCRSEATQGRARSHRGVLREPGWHRPEHGLL